jgi:hypothetical protein
VVRFVVRSSRQSPSSRGWNAAPMRDFSELTVRLPYFRPPEIEWGSGARGFKSRRPDCNTTSYAVGSERITRLLPVSLYDSTVSQLPLLTRDSEERVVCGQPERSWPS